MSEALLLLLALQQLLWQLLQELLVLILRVLRLWMRTQRWLQQPGLSGPPLLS